MNRVFLKVLGGLLLLVAIAGVGLKAYFTSDRLRAMLVPELSSALKREVCLQDVGLGFWGGAPRIPVRAARGRTSGIWHRALSLGG